jgi:hypothetical protein
MHPFNYPYAIPLSFDDIEPYRTRYLQIASTQKYSMPKTYDTATESWIFLDQGSAMNVFQPFNHFSATLPQQGISLKTPDADFHQLNSNYQPTKVCANMNYNGQWYESCKKSNDYSPLHKRKLSSPCPQAYHLGTHLNKHNTTAPAKTHLDITKNNHLYLLPTPPAQTTTTLMP